MIPRQVGVGVIAVGGQARLYALSGNTNQPNSCNGHAGSPILTSVEYFAHAVGAWTELPAKQSLPACQSFLGIAVLRGTLFVIGGWDATKIAVASAVSFDPRGANEDTTWPDIRSLPKASVAFGAAGRR